MLLLVSTHTAAQVPDRSGPPELGPPPSLELPPLQELRLSNGLRVMLMEKHDVPLVQLNVLVMVGSAYDSRDKVGLASLTADMMDEGAGGRDALEFADAIEFLGASIRSTAGTHTSRIALHTPLAKFNEALPLVADVLLRPIFPEDELERKRISRLTSLLQGHDEPNAVAAVLFNEALYGDRHPYGFSPLSNESSIRSYTVDDLREFHGSYFRPNNAVLILVGDITADVVMPELESAFGEWQPGEVPTQSWPSVGQVDRREVLLVDKPGAPQSVIRIGRIGVDRFTDDYYALQVMNTILGGAFTSRLNQNLREDKGYTYGAFSSFSFRKMAGPFTASAQVQSDATDESLSEFMRELNGILEPVPAEELNRAKNYLALQYPGGFQSVSRIASNLEQLAVYDLPPEYFNNYVERVLAVTQEDVQRVARQYLDPERIKIIVVGDRESIEADVRALDLGRVRNLTIEDVLGAPPSMER
jgi:predicted Zn-dependent peptidase